LWAATAGLAGAQNTAPPRARGVVANAIVRENQQPGTTDWLVMRIEDAAANERNDRYRRQRAIEGYVSRSRTSVRGGDTRIAGLVGWEHHGPPYRNDQTLDVVAAGPVSDSRGNRQPDTHGAVVYAGGNGSVVFNAGTCWWNMVLSTPPGFVTPPNKDFARPDPRVQQITRNLLARIIGGREVVVP